MNSCMAILRKRFRLSCQGLLRIPKIYQISFYTYGASPELGLQSEPLTGLLGRIGEHGTRLIVKANGFADSFYELLRLSLNLRCTSFAAALEEFAWMEVGSNPTPDFSRGLASWLSAPFLSSSVLKFLSPNRKEAYLEILISAYGMRPFVAAALLSSGMNTSTPAAAHAIEWCRGELICYFRSSAVFGTTTCVPS